MRVFALVVFALLRRLPALDQPVDLVGFRVSPLTHPVLETRQQHDRDRIGRGRGDRTDDDLRVDRDERRLSGDRSGDEFYRIPIRPWHKPEGTTPRLCEPVSSRSKDR